MKDKTGLLEAYFANCSLTINSNKPKMIKKNQHQTTLILDREMLKTKIVIFRAALSTKLEGRMRISKLEFANSKIVQPFQEGM